jgi:hypothetical protein
MRKVSAVFLLVLSFFFARTFVTPAEAGTYTCTTSVSPSNAITYSTNAAHGATLAPNGSFTVSFTVPANGGDIQNPSIQLCDESANGIFFCSSGEFAQFPTTRNGNTFTATIPASRLAGKSNSEWTGVFRGNFAGQGTVDMCQVSSNIVTTRDISDTAAIDCSQLTFSPNPIIASTTQVTVSYPRSAIADAGTYELKLYEWGANAAYSSGFQRGTGTMSHTFNISPTNLGDGAHITLDRKSGLSGQAVCTVPLHYNQATGEVEVTDPVENVDGPTVYVEGFDYCKQAPAGPQRAACQACVGGNTDDQQKVYTAFGCMGTSGEDLTVDLVRLLLGVVGGIALLSILSAAFLLTTSQGEVSKVKSAKELITASVSGILFIIFSIMILNFIGVKVLRIPGLL